MTVQEAIELLQYAPLTVRIQAVELLLQSLKDEITRYDSVADERKPFRVRTFDLGADMRIDREGMYADRVY